MSFDPTTVIGQSYLTVNQFKQMASAFGCGGATITLFSDIEIQAALSAVSRAIENYTNLDWSASPRTESQNIDLYTNRIRVDFAPVTAISAVTIPNFGGTVTVSVADLKVNNLENYIELPQSAITAMNLPTQNYYGNAITSPLVCQITYTSGQTLPPKNILTATGFATAWVLNMEAANRQTLLGLNTATTGEDTTTRAGNGFADLADIALATPGTAKLALRGMERVVPRGYPSRGNGTLGRYWRSGGYC